jgi:alkylhydroperoxidase/carboxymuconolactone decarboxylase family protein YurZ
MVSAKGRKDLLPSPDYFSAKGILRDSDWVEAYVATVLQWPKGCRISLKDRQLIGLAKSLAFSWEPGILNHTDLAINTGSTPEQVTEVIKAVAASMGLASLDRAASTFGTYSMAAVRKLDLSVKGTLKPVEDYFGTLPRCFRHKAVVEEPAWLADVVTVAKPAFDSSEGIVEPRVRALVCLAAASVVGWSEGIQLYSRAAMKFGSTDKQAKDVVRSVFKTTVSNAMAAGFRTPCHIPKLDGYRTMVRAFVEKGALTGKGRDPLLGPSH